MTTTDPKTTAVLKTFGRPRLVNAAGDDIALQPLPVALLAYLARGGARDRDHLAEMFWRNSKNGLNSLSTTLNRIRDVVPNAVQVDGNTVVDTNITSDVDLLLDAVDRGDAAAMVELYHAPFLGNLKLRRQNAEFEEWVLAERTLLATTVEMALLQQAGDLFDTGSYRPAADVAERAWQIAIRDGFPSPNHFERYHQILATNARPSVAEVRSLAEEFDIDLPPVEPISPAAGRSEIATGPREPGAPSTDHGLGAARATAQLFGCEQELAAITSSVTSAQLTSIIGLGGSGKTRLATEFFEHPTTEHNFFARHWVNMREVHDADLIGPAIATALGQRFTDIADLAARFPDDEPVLLVLDNLEQILDTVGPVITELVAGCATLRILVTSRVPLEVPNESLVRLSGLDWTTGELNSPAARLFLASAHRAGVSSERLADSSPAILDVCRRVGGNPLSLEIVGGWTQILSPAEIFEALTLSDELLSSPMTGGLRDMDTVLTQSWSTLQETEQNTLMLLATFPAGCLTTQALELPELSIASVGRLVQHSLVELHVEGRITLHPLIAGHARSELSKQPDLHHTFHQLLSTWCEGFAADAANTAHSPGLEAEIANFTNAWSWDAQHGRWDLHRVTLGPLRQFFTDTGRLTEGKALFSATVKVLRSEPNLDQALLARLLEAVGWFQTMTGEVDQARTLLDEAFALSIDGNPTERAQLLRTRGQLNLVTGDAEAAAADFETGLALTDGHESPLTATLRYDLAQAHRYRGEHERAAKAARSALQAGRAANDPTAVVRAYLLLADLEIESDPNRAVVLANEGAAVAEEAALDQFAMYFPQLLGLAHLQLNEPELAARYFGEGLKAAADVGQSYTVSANHFGRAEALLMGGQTAAAIDDLTTGIRLALKIRSVRLLAQAAVASCRLALSVGHGTAEQARSLLTLVLGHPATDRSVRKKATATWHDYLDGAIPKPSGNPDEPAGPDEVAELTLELLSSLDRIATADTGSASA